MVFPCPDRDLYLGVKPAHVLILLGISPRKSNVVLIFICPPATRVSNWTLLGFRCDCCLFLCRFCTGAIWKEEIGHPCRIWLTVFRIHREIGLSLQNAVDQLGAVPIRLIIGVRRSDGDNSRPCAENKGRRVNRQTSS